VTTTTRLSFAFLALVVGACGPTITLSDEIDLTWDFAPSWSRFDATLHSPYVTGTQLTLHVTSSDDKEDMSGWSIRSSDPTVIAIDSTGTDTDGIVAMAHTIGAGSADLFVLDAKGKTVGHGHTEVAAPDRVELDAHAYLIMGMNDQAAVDAVRIVQGGTATYLVRYFNNDRELHGYGVLAVNAPTAITATPRTTFLQENREWLQLTASAGGDDAIEMIVDGVSHGLIATHVVAETDIANVVLIGQSEKGRKDGDWLVAYAQAYDAPGNRLFGVDYTWSIDGVQQTGDGDLYRYEYKQGMYQTVTATRGALKDSAQIQSDGGFVDSSNNIGCADAGGGGSGLGVIAMAAIVIVRRRRRYFSATTKSCAKQPASPENTPTSNASSRDFLS
jgi:hypothetical protein